MGRSDVAPPSGVLRTPLTLQMLDRTTFTVWGDGQESAVPLPAPKNGPDQVLWTQNSSVEWSGVEFGDSKTPGARYLRIGFTAPVPVGSVLVRGGGQLSVLKAGVPYPGHLNVPTEWVAAQRLVTTADRSSGGGGSDIRVGAAEVGREEYAVWVLPPGTQTRAIRFAHTPNPIDRSYAGWLGGAYVLADRLTNVAPQAQATTQANPEKADLLNDSDNNRMWGAWDNLSRDHRDPTERAEPISHAHPEDILLTWPRPVVLNGLCALWAGFAAVEVQTYTGIGDPRKENQSSEGKSNENPDGNSDGNSDGNWKTIRAYFDIQTQYPRALGVNWLDFGQSVTTRAVRLRVTQATVENHDHLRGSTLGGRRIWLGELLALRPLGNAPLADAILPRPVAPASHPPIPIAINLPTPGYVTLVIEDTRGRRVRNLLSATYFPKSGPQTVWWDGMDDLGRDTEAARHGIYSTPGQFVAPGSYRVRGLVRPEIDLHYEFSPYNAGHPAWETADHTGGWLTNHTPPGCALFVPGEYAPGGQPLVFLGSYVSEGGDGLAWVDLDGHKRGGRGWIGGTWTGAQYLARDAAATTGGEPDIYAYVGAGWESDKSKDEGEIRLTGLTARGDRPVLKYLFTPGGEIDPKATREHEWGNELGGLAVHKGLLVFSLTRQNRLVCVDVRSGAVRAELPLPAPRGLAFDAEGNLLALSDRSLVRYSAEGIKGLATIQFSALKPETIVSSGLDQPIGIALDREGNRYISDWGESHQVKVFSPDGKLLRTIGHPGAPRTGRYDREHMNHPKGLTIDERNQLWVAEEDYQPKRVSVWSLEGKLLRDFYGPSQYGGGGTLDPKDKTRFYYTGMEFKLDWKQGTDRLVNVFFRPDTPEMKEGQARAGTGNDAMPETPLYAHGTQYLTNAYNYSPTNGAPIAMLWQLREGVAHPVAAMGRANDWPVLKGEPFRSLWPQGVDLTGEYWRNQAFFVWCDRNGDGKVQPEEVTIRKSQAGGVTLMPNLTFVESRVDERTMAYAPVGFTPQGVPLYDLDKGRAVATGAQGPVSSGGDQALLTPDGWTILTNAPKPFSPYGIGGVKNGVPLWTYPSVWPGLHASHESAAPDRPGELVGTTRLLGTSVTPLKGDAGPLWAINGNMGNFYLFTSDGLFVAQLFQDVRQGQTWSMPVGTRGMNLNVLTLHDENFWPSLTQTLPDGNIYCVDGARTSLVRLDGLEAIHRLSPVTISVSATDLRKAADYVLATEAQRQQASGPHRLQVVMQTNTLTVPARWEGDLDAWKGADWVTVDKRGVAAFFNSDSRPYDVRAALMVAGDRLYAAYRTGDKDLLRNSGETPNALFKTGGALDLMLGTDPNADPKRQGAMAGDLRLLVTRVNGKLRALLYRAVLMPGAGAKEPVPFRSPSRGITFDRVDDVSEQIQLASDEKGDYIVSIPLSTLGWHPQPGQRLRGDIGLLRGNGFQTLQRIYWSNKATGITADVPSEAELTPQLWGEWEVR